MFFSSTQALATGGVANTIVYSVTLGIYAIANPGSAHFT